MEKKQKPDVFLRHAVTVRACLSRLEIMKRQKEETTGRPGVSYHPTDCSL